MPSLLPVVPVFWLVVFVLWSPLLLSDRVRVLVARWPSDVLALNYALYVVLVATAHLLALLVPAALVFDVSRVSGGFPLYFLGVNLAFPALCWAIVAGLPTVADRVAPTRQALLPLAVGAVWYALFTTGAFLLAALVLLFLSLPL